MAVPRTLECLVGVARAPQRRGHGDTEPRAIAATHPTDAQIARRLESLGVRGIAADDPAFPAGLRDVPRPPRVVFVRGAIPERARAVAIVGSRAASPYGIAQASRLAGELARLGLAVVSGLARGIDAAAHHGALDAGGESVAVLPGGLDAITPGHHAPLSETLARRGALLSEWPSGPPRYPGRFVERNRLIAGLAAATVVVEAAERSGALSTAAAATRLGRPVLAVPGDVDRPTSRGCHALLRSGAAVCEDAGDVMRALEASGTAPALPGATGRLRAALTEAPRPLEALAREAGVGFDEALVALLDLEWSGAAVALPGQRWMRRGS